MRTTTEQPAEPLVDYRFTLANERTFLAWIRTALGLLAGGVAVQTLADQFATSSLRRITATACAALAMVIAAVAHRQWRRVQAAMTRGAALPNSALIPVVAVGVTVVAGTAAVAVLVA